MNILENYSLQLGQKINRCYTYEKYYPLSVDGPIIVLQPWSKGAKNYSSWNDVLDILYPILEKNGYKLIQVGGPNELPLKYCYHTQGQTNWGQLEYLISKANLVISTDSISAHLAGHYNIPLCVLISNNFKECVAPYFGDKSKQIILEPNRTNKNPLFMLEESGKKQIDEILPEIIAESCCKLLNISYDWPYKTIYQGEISIANMFISSCDSVINPKQFGLNQIICDLTLNFNEQILAQQCQISDVSIITNKPININLIKSFKPKIKEIIYSIDSVECSKPDFCKEIQRIGIPFRVICDLDQELINKLKEDWFEVALLFPKPRFIINNLEQFKNKNINELYFKSAKFYAGRGKLYPSKEHYIQDVNTQGFDDILPIINNDGFWSELDSYKIFSKIV